MPGEATQTAVADVDQLRARLRPQLYAIAGPQLHIDAHNRKSVHSCPALVAHN